MAACESKDGLVTKVGWPPTLHASMQDPILCGICSSSPRQSVTSVELVGLVTRASLNRIMRSDELFGHTLPFNMVPHQSADMFGCLKSHRPDTKKSFASVRTIATYTSDTLVSPKNISSARTLSRAPAPPLPVPHSCRSRANASCRWSQH